MNVFPLVALPNGEPDYVRSARAHDDSRVFKMALEAAQIAHTVLNDWRDPDCYRPSHERHPLTRWAGMGTANLRIVVAYGLACLAEAERRYRRTYPKMRRALEWAARRIPVDPEAGPTPQPLCMPEAFKGTGIVESYVAYFNSKPQRWTRAANPFTD